MIMPGQSVDLTSLFLDILNSTYNRTSMARTLMVHSLGLELSSLSLQVILGIIHPGWVELPLARTSFHGPRPVRATEVLLYT